VMWRRQVEEIRKRSKASSDGPWVTDWDEMAKKTVLRRLCKLLPASIELQTAVSLDERAEAGIPQDIEILDVQAEVVVDHVTGEITEAGPAKPTALDAVVEQKKATVLKPKPEPAKAADLSSDDISWN